MKTCYVCGGPIRENPLYIGQGKYRHRSKCAPGSEQWMRSEVGKASQARRYFKAAGKRSEPDVSVSSSEEDALPSANR